MPNFCHVVAQLFFLLQREVKQGILRDLIQGARASEHHQELTLDLPAGAEASGSWKRPASQPYPDDPSLLIYKGDGVFLRRVRLSNDFQGGKLEVKVTWQACDPMRCLPPSSKTLETRLQ